MLHHRQEIKSQGTLLFGCVDIEPNEFSNLCRLYIDVKLGSMSKVPKIAVNDNDDPNSLAKDFCRVYSLRGNAQSTLANVIRESMLQHGIPVKAGDNDRREPPHQQRLETEVPGSDETKVNTNGRLHAPHTAPPSHAAPPPPPPPPRLSSEKPAGGHVDGDSGSIPAPNPLNKVDSMLNKYFLSVEIDASSDGS